MDAAELLIKDLCPREGLPEVLAVAPVRRFFDVTVYGLGSTVSSRAGSRFAKLTYRALFGE